MTPNTHIIDTANHNNYDLALRAAATAKMDTRTDYRRTCCKCYHAEITAATPEQDYILTLIALATTAHPDQDTYKKKLSKFTTGNYTTIENFMDDIRQTA